MRYTTKFQQEQNNYISTLRKKLLTKDEEIRKLKIKLNQIHELSNSPSRDNKN